MARAVKPEVGGRDAHHRGYNRPRPGQMSAHDQDGPLSRDISTLGRLLGDVLREQEGEAGFALVEDYRALQKRIGTSRNVIVQPSTYGIDNRCTLDATVAFGPTARAVVVVNDTVSDAELKRMHGLGARGIRFNLAQAGATTPEMMMPLSRRVNDLGWHIQINAPPAKIMEVMPILDKVPSPIVFDHLAHVPDVNDPLFGEIRKLLDKGRTWVKLSGAYADTKVGPPTYADRTAVARAYVAAAPERCVWGSDWPHPTEHSKQLPDDAVLLDLLTEWVPDEKVRRRILVENPATLYDYPKGA